MHRPQYDDWTLPKGKTEPGESDEECALREVEEETGLRCELREELESSSYSDAAGRPKVARYWLMRPVGGRLRPTMEVDDARWVPLRDAEADSATTATCVSSARSAGAECACSSSGTHARATAGNGSATTLTGRSTPRAASRRSASRRGSTSSGRRDPPSDLPAPGLNGRKREAVEQLQHDPFAQAAAADLERDAEQVLERSRRSRCRRAAPGRARDRCPYRPASSAAGVLAQQVERLVELARPQRRADQLAQRRVPSRRPQRPAGQAEVSAQRAPRAPRDRTRPAPSCPADRRAGCARSAGASRGRPSGARPARARPCRRRPGSEPPPTSQTATAPVGVIAGERALEREAGPRPRADRTRDSVSVRAREQVR